MNLLQHRFAAMTRRSLFSVLVLGAILAVRGDQPSAPVRPLEGPPGPVPIIYFGMHVHRLLETTPWPSVPFGAIRLWDTRTTWKQLEPRKNDWRFDRLDRLVNLAADHHVQVLLCFGKTPAWASSVHAADEQDVRVESAPPANLEDWRHFIEKVASRYKGKIEAYEVWNEPNVHGTYTGDVHTMVEMTRIASETIHAIDPAALVISPSATSFDGLPWFEDFLEQGGGRYVDVIAYHLYVYPDAPERIPALAAEVRSRMIRNHVNLPVWDTETGWSKPKTFSSTDEASAYVARSLLLAWAAGFSRFYWYAWDNRDWCTLLLTTDDQHASVNAIAYEGIENWMVGRKINRCANDLDHTWTCHLTGEEGDSYIFWNPDHQRSYRLPENVDRGSTWQLVDLYGNVSPVSKGTLIADQQPRLLRQIKH
jgi:Glycosyl hydrolases family 39